MAIVTYENNPCSVEKQFIQPIIIVTIVNRTRSTYKI